jgi:GNAT superfamily N-acetyltransferase
MTPDLRIRPLRRGEEFEACALVERVWRDCIRDEFTDEGARTFLAYAGPEALRARSGPGQVLLVAEWRGILAGMIETRGNDHVSLLFVEHRGLGLARALFQDALERCRERRPDLARMTVNASLYAVPAYRQLGFVATGEARTDHGISYAPMVLDLGAASD